MGNSNSHGSSSYATRDTQSIPPHSWAYSFPRSQYFRPPSAGSKVLPPPVPGQRLKTTENGSMLHNAGTINGKRPYEYLHRDEVRRMYATIIRNFYAPKRRKIAKTIGSLFDIYSTWRGDSLKIFTKFSHIRFLPPI